MGCFFQQQQKRAISDIQEKIGPLVKNEQIMLGLRLCRLKHSKEGCGKVECIVTKFFGYRRDFLKGDHNLCDKRAFFCPLQPKEGFGFWFLSCCEFFVVSGCFFIPGKKTTKEWIDILKIFVISDNDEKILDFVKFCKNYTIL